MIALPAGAKILLATKPVDFRKGAHSLAALAAEVLGADPFSGAVLVFRSKRPQRLSFGISKCRGADRVSLAPAAWTRAAHSSAIFQGPARSVLA
jgi:transposase